MSGEIDILDESGLLLEALPENADFAEQREKMQINRIVSPDRPAEPFMIWRQDGQLVESYLGDEIFGWKLIFIHNDYALFSQEINGQTQYADVYLKK